MDCIFCKIINKEIPANIIYENEEVIAFLDVNPINEGHTLLVPKKHYKNILEKEDNIDLLKYVQEIISILKDTYNFNDFKININNGEKAGQEVFHLHIHIIPYY